MTPFRVRSVSLENAFVRIEPLKSNHAPALFEIGQNPATWRWMPTPAFGQALDAANWVTKHLHDQLAGTRVPFVIRRLSDNRLVGSTALYDFRAPERALEIGTTWLSPDACRTPVNTATKLLLLTHCFEALGCLRVQFKTDARNEISQRAIERLGATREGTLRKHMRLHDGFIRDTVFYSILPEEWPAIKARLTTRLSQT